MLTDYCGASQRCIIFRIEYIILESTSSLERKYTCEVAARPRSLDLIPAVLFPSYLEMDASPYFENQFIVRLNKIPISCAIFRTH